MKVLQINSVCQYGSTGRIATDLDRTIKSNGFGSRIAFGRDSAPADVSAIRIGNDFDIWSHVAKTRIFDTHGFGSINATKRFIEQVKQYDPDIIHLHNLHGYYINVRVLFDYLKYSGKPVIWTLHDCWSFTGHCAYFSYVNCERWVEGCYKCPQKRTYPASAFFDNSQQNYYAKKALFTSLENMTIVTPSQWLADLVGKSFLSKYPVKVIHNGIDTDIFKRVADKLAREKFKLGHKFIILGVASMWDKRKGLSYFINLSEMIEDDCLIVLVGLDEKQMKELPPNIIGIKRTSNINELAEIYSTADVFINPTLEDNFPTVNLEALACGTPVITFDAGGSPEAVDDNCGYVVDIGNLSDIEQIINIVRRKGKDHYSKQCIKRVKDNFSKKKCSAEYVELYRCFGVK